MTRPAQTQRLVNWFNPSMHMVGCLHHAVRLLTSFLYCCRCTSGFAQPSKPLPVCNGPERLSDQELLYRCLPLRAVLRDRSDSAKQHGRGVTGSGISLQAVAGEHMDCSLPAIKNNNAITLALCLPRQIQQGSYRQLAAACHWHSPQQVSAAQWDKSIRS
jgi:hypothetical protein